MQNRNKLTKKVLACFLCLAMMIPLVSVGFIPSLFEGVVPTAEAYSTFSKNWSTEYYYPSGTNFVKNIALVYYKDSNEGKNAIRNIPCTLVDKDLTAGTGGDYYVYMGFNTTTDPTAANACKGIRISHNNEGISGEPNSCTQSGATWWKCNTGANGTYAPQLHGDGAVDLNKGAGGDDMKTYATYDRAFGPAITAISANATQRLYSTGWTDVQDFGGAYRDVNQGAGGEDIYLHYYTPCTTVNTTTLRNNYSTILTCYNNSSRYVSVSGLTSSLNTAQTILNDVNDGYTTYTQSQIDAAATALLNAGSTLQTRVYLNAGTNGGTVNNVAETSFIVTIGTASSVSTNLSSYAGVKANWTFKGWSTSSTQTTAGTTGSVTVGFNTRYYALFNRTITATFRIIDAVGGSSTRSASVTMWNNATAGSVTTNAGVTPVTYGGDSWNFLGYRTDTAATTQTLNGNASVSISDNITYNAVYSRSNLTLSYNANGGSGAPASQTATQYFNAAVPGTRTSAAFTISTTQPTRTAYTFAGWSTTAGGSVQYAPGASVSLTDELTLFAVWNPIGYSISYNVNGGNSVAATSYNIQSTTTLPAATRVGYNFAGWIPAANAGNWVSGTNYAAGTSVNGKYGSPTMTAQWTPRTDTAYTVYHYQMKLDGSGYDLVATENMQGTTASAITLSDYNKTYTGFTFDHASLTAGGATVTGTTTILADGSRAIHIYYSRNQYAVSLVAGEGIASVTGDGTYYYGATVAVGATPAGGYSWSNWTGYATSTEPTFSFTLGAGDAALTANATINGYTVTYNNNNGTVSTIGFTSSYNVLSTISVPTSGTRTAYTFTGWTVTATDGTANNWPATIDVATGSLAAGKYGNVTLTAQWQPRSYTLTLAEAGGLDVNDINYTIESAATLPAISRAGFKFTGWKVTTVGGSWARNAVFAAGTAITGNYGNATLTAQWSDVIYTLSFDANHGTVADASLTYTTVNNPNLVLPTPTRPGYTFAGWLCTEATAHPDSAGSISWITDELYNAGYSLTGAYGHASLVAQWTPNTYAVTTSLTHLTYVGGALGAVDTDYNATLVAAAGYNLPAAITLTIGGNTATAGTEYTYNPLTGAIAINGAYITAPITITAAGELITFAIDYNYDEGVAVNPVSYSAESSAITLNTPVREGYRFIGWSGTELSELTMTVTIPAGSSGDRSYVANWSKLYTVTFYNAGGTAIEPIVYAVEDTVVIPTPEKANAKFRAWNIETASGTWVAGTLAPASYQNMTGDVALTAVFSAASNYTVEEYFMTLDGDYTAAPVTTYFTDDVYVDDTASFAMNTYTGFTADAAASTLTGTIAADGLVLKAYYTRNTYSVSVDTDAGIASVSGAADYYYQQTVTLAVTIKDGYSFVDWTDDFTGDETSLTFTMPADDVAVSANTELIDYTVTFDANGGAPIEDLTYNVVDTVNLPTPVRAGYTFTSWTLVADSGNWTAGNYAADAHDGKIGDVSLVANWTANPDTPYVVNYYCEDVNADTYTLVDTDNMTGTTDTIVAAPAYNYDGFTTPSASALTINGDESTVVNYFFTRNSYTLTTIVYGVSSAATYEFEAPVTVPADPEIAGYTFNGWNPEYPTAMPAANTTVEAELTINVYTVTFDVSGGEEILPFGYTIYSTVEIPTPVKANAKFRYWNIETASGTWAAGALQPDSFNNMTGDVTLKAIFSDASSYTVEEYFMDIDGIFPTTPDISTVYSDGVYVDDTASTSMYAHEGFTADSALSTLEGVVTADGLVLKAYYDRNQYAVSVAGDEGIASVTGAGDYYYEHPATVTATLKDGYTFAGWTGSFEGDETSLTFNTPAADAAVTANTDAIDYTITFDANLGVAVDAINYIVTDIVTLPTPVRAGYTFTGWVLAETVEGWAADTYEAGEYTGKFGNISLLATWVANTDTPYVINYYCADGKGGYTLRDTAAKTGTTDTLVLAPEMAYYGFITPAASTLTINGDESTVVNYYYEIITYAIAYDANGGVIAGDYDTEYTILNKISLPIPTRVGYKFLGWTVSVDSVSNWAEELDTSDLLDAGKYGDVTLTAKWYAKKVTVKVVHYLQYTYDDTYVVLDQFTDYMTADSTADVAEMLKNAPGMYYFEKAIVDNQAVSTFQVKPDGSTEVDIYYLRNTYNVTVNYTAPDGVTAPETFTEAYRYGEEYSVGSPKLKGYTPNVRAIAGIMGTEDVTGDVSYAINYHTVTVNYRFTNLLKAAETKVETVAYDSEYIIASPEITGYTADTPAVRGTMDDENIKVTVTYAVNPYTLTINYTKDDGTVAAETVTKTVNFDARYSVNSPVVAGYTANIGQVAGTMPAEDVTVDVIYNVNYYTVTFQNYDGTVIDVQSVAYGSGATAPAAPEKPADETYTYTFKGWTKSYSRVTEDITTVAEYTAVRIDTGEPDGGEDDDVNTGSFWDRIVAFFRMIFSFLKIKSVIPM